MYKLKARRDGERERDDLLLVLNNRGELALGAALLGRTRPPLLDDHLVMAHLSLPHGLLLPPPLVLLLEDRLPDELLSLQSLTLPLHVHLALELETGSC